MRVFFNFFLSETDSLTILMGFADGRIRLTNIKDNNLSDFGDYIEYSVHDNKTGRVNMLCLSQDNYMLYTCGDDCNIFSFMFQCNYKNIDEPPQPPVLVVSNVIKYHNLKIEILIYLIIRKKKL
jgi:WD40 repeat protein